MNSNGSTTPLVDRPQFINRTDEKAILMKGLQSAKKGRGGMILIEGEAGIGKSRLIDESVHDSKQLGFKVMIGKCLDYHRSPYLPFIEMLRDYFGVSIDRIEEETKEDLLRSIEMEFSSIEHHKDEFLDFFFPRGEITGGFRIGPTEERGLLEEMQMRGYRTVVFGNDDTFHDVTQVRNNVTLLPIEDEKREGINPRRIERIAVRIKETFENNKRCALIFNGIDLIAKKNPQNKLTSLIAIAVDMALKNSGVLIFSTKDPKKTKVVDLPVLDPSHLDPDDRSQEEISNNDNQGTSIYELLQPFFKEVSFRVPTLLVIEDLQWGDKATYNLIQFLARDAREGRLLIIGSYRSEESTIEEQSEGHMPLRDALQRMSREHLFTTMKLDRFDQKKSAQLAAAILGQEMDMKDIGAMMRKTEGNPLFIRDYIRTRMNDGFLSLEPTMIEQSTGEDLTAKRTGSLSETERNVLEVSAVLVESITVENIQMILGLEIGDILDSVDRLMELKFLIDKEDHFEFEHPKVIESIYEGLEEERKKELHRMISSAFESKEVSNIENNVPDLSIHHYFGGEFDKALDELTVRAQTHLDDYDIDGALQSIQMAQECIDELEDNRENLVKEIIILQLEGDIFDEKGQVEKGISSLKKAVEIAEKNDIGDGLSTSYRRIGDLLLKRYDWDNTLEHYLKSLHLSKVEEDKGEVARAFKGLGRIYLLKGDYHRSMECYIKYMEHPETRSGPANVRGMTEMGDIYSQMGDFNQALAYYKLAIKKGEEGSIKNETSLAYIKMADVLLKLGEFEDSRRFADLAREAVHSTDPSTATLETLLHYTDLMLEVGQMDKAEEVVSELDGSIDGMDRLLRAFAYRVKGVLLSRQRDFRGSISQMKAAVKTLEELNVPYDLAMTYFHFGLIRFQQMDVEGALEMLKKASKIFKEIKSMYYLNRTSSKLREVSFIREGLRT